MTLDVQRETQREKQGRGKGLTATLENIYLINTKAIKKKV